MKKSILLLLAVILFNTTVFSQNSWAQKENFEGTVRLSAVGFSIGTKGYIGTGNDGSEMYKDFWEYNPTNNIWTQKADFGGTIRVGAVGFSIGTKGYIGTGGMGYIMYKDFWEYDTTTNTWLQKADFAGTARSEAVCFSIGSKGYIGLGTYYNGTTWIYYKDFWEYDPITDTWIQKSDFGGTARAGAVGFSIGTKGYVGTGNSGSLKKDFWEYDPITDTWIQKSDFGGTARAGAVGFSIGTKGYVGTGNDGSLKNDFWEYNPGTDTWTLKANFDGAARSDASGFAAGIKGYIGTGYTSNGIVKDFWEYYAMGSQKPHLTHFDNNNIQITFGAIINSITANDTSILIWGETTGKRSGNYSTSGVVITFIPNLPFNPGEKISITSTTSVLDTSGFPMPASNWDKYVSVTSVSQAIFDTVYTGYQLPQNSYHIISTDVDKDGRLDILTCGRDQSYGYAIIRIFIQNSDGTFQNPATYTAPEHYNSWFETPDLNNDGYPDIITSHNLSSKIIVLLNNGDGTFTNTGSYPVTSFNDSFTYGDIDNDGDIDIVATPGNSDLAVNQIDILKNNGDGTFIYEAPLPLGNGGRNVKLGDIDNDGDLDLMASTYNYWGGTSLIEIFNNDGSGKLNLYRTYPNANNSVANIYDFNNDGNKDFISFLGDITSSQIYYYSGNGDLTFNNPVTIPSTNIGWESGPFGDIDGDGTMDFIITSRNDAGASNYSRYFNDGNANFSFLNGTNLRNTGSVHNLADIDNDGDLDFAYLTPEAKLCIAYNRNCFNFIPVVELGVNQTGCDGDTIILNAYTPCCTYLWSTGGTHANCSVTASGIYSVTVTNSFGYSATDSVMVTINALPPDPIITQNGNTLSSSIATGNQWYNQNGLINGATSQTFSPATTGDYYVIVTQNGCSSNTSNILHFSPEAPIPVVSTVAATNITSNSATINGIVMANNLSTTVTFDYGTTTNYEYNVNANPNIVNGNSNTNVTCQLTGLSPNTTYHFRVNAVNTGGTANGSDKTFITSVNSIEDEISKKFNVAINPNPSTGSFFLTFEIPDKQNIRVEVINTAGEIIYKDQQNNYNGKYAKIIELKDCSEGAYLIRLCIGNAIVVKKLIKQK